MLERLYTDYKEILLSNLERKVVEEPKVEIAEPRGDLPLESAESIVDPSVEDDDSKVALSSSGEEEVGKEQQQS
ncbi:hypothetical protein [Borrelia persica]|uniref:hypothetical protein n=1 Tax=Borrelia persica TaxID=44448 RepID=UPI001F169ABA|nr:hypothetical protein [Borrelia persica]